ncbi:MAG: hypothetical protein LDL41_23625 [Coleofasciculus sp. S288]|nr:hypothetical protein [Coleofasciculus sp. S288]
MDKPETQVRHVGAKEVSFTCYVCKQTITQWRFLSPIPKYCDESITHDVWRFGSTLITAFNCDPLATHLSHKPQFLQYSPAG